MRNKQKYTLDKDLAHKSLQNILQACELIPDESDMVQKERRKHINAYTDYKRMMFAATAALFLLLASPIFFRITAHPLEPVRVSSQTTLTVKEHHLDAGIFYITFSGADIAYENILILNEKGELLPLLSCDEDAGSIAFEFTGEEELNLFIPDTDGRTLQLLLSPPAGAE